MCGINAIYAYAEAAPPIEVQELLATRDRMRTRGPDSADHFIDLGGRLGLAHRRLAIIDLSPAGSQPLRCGQLAIILNGEIYNYQELRRELESEGVVFTSHSDTEVALRLFERDGPAMLGKLRGMFALVIWDARTQKIFLARDPYGIKPLYYADDGATFRAASQVQAIAAGGKVSRQFDPAGAASFFLRGSLAEPFTMYRSIRMLPAGSYAWVGPGGMEPPRAYVSIAATLREAVEVQADRNADRGSAQQRIERIHEAVLESVRAHLVSDVPIGMFLSAGIDSTALLGYLREAGATDLQTLTLRFEEYRGAHNDEAPLAAKAAQYYGLRHTIRELSRGEFLEAMPRFFDAMDQPTVDGVNSYFISKAAAEMGLKVVLSGAGGDELFGGYSSFRDIPRFVPLVSVLSRIPGLSNAMFHANAALARRSRHVRPKTGELLRLGSTYAGAYLVKRGRFLAAELPQLMGAERAAEGLARLDLNGLIEATITPDPGTPFTRVAAMEASLYLRNQGLRDADWASMAHSLEVRVPLVDAHLLRRLAPLMAIRRGRGKQMFAQSVRPPLPPEIRNRRKTGFTVPIRQWLQKEGIVDVGKRSWALRVYEIMYSDQKGHW